MSAESVALVRCQSLSEMLALTDDEVRVWEIPLDRPMLSPDELLNCLTAEERVRANRYRVERARRQFVVTRGLLRMLLARHLDKMPVQVSIGYTGVGKPHLLNEPSAIQFNVSHTDGVALIAWSRCGLGVDVEKPRPMADQDGLVARFFSRVEQNCYRSLDPGLRFDAFFRGWTCKEAIIKAAGLSVSCLDDFDVELNPREPARLLGARHPRLAASRWRLAEWCPYDHHAAAIAVEDVDEIR